MQIFRQVNSWLQIRVGDSITLIAGEPSFKSGFDLESFYEEAPICREYLSIENTNRHSFSITSIMHIIYKRDL